jgi:hypothetical protein
MSEAASNVEFAHKIFEHGHHPESPNDRRAEFVEIVEAVVLAIVAIATAWSGYQVAKWDALSIQESWTCKSLSTIRRSTLSHSPFNLLSS